MTKKTIENFNTELNVEFIAEFKADAELEQAWQQCGFTRILTADGSISLRPIEGKTELSESMHHSGGAFSESIYIYGNVLRDWLSRNDKVQDETWVLSLGLGLGYNEIIATAVALQLGKKIQIISFEANEKLKQNFIDFLEESTKAEFFKEYIKIIEITAECFGLNHEVLLSKLVHNYKEQKIILDGPLDLDWLQKNRQRVKFDVVFYDAYSSSTSPELWSENFLSLFMESVLKPNCYFASYAVTGALKRSLKKYGFTFQEKPGFKNKRECTYATRICD